MNKKKHAGRKLKYFGLACLAILVVISILIPSTQFLPYTTDSPKPDGTKALYLLLNKAEFGVSKLLTTKPQQQGLMIMVEPNDHFRENDWKEVVEWVDRGNTLLLASDSPNGIYKHFNLELVEVSGAAKTGHINSNNRLLQDIRELSLPGKARLKQHQSMAFTYGDDQGIYFAELIRGEGRIIFLTLPELFTNKEINQKDNLILLLNIIRTYGQEGIWINEAVHGYSWEKASREVFAWPLGLVVLQLAVAVVMLYWLWGRRFGRPIPLPESTGQTLGDYVSSLANIYRQGRAQRLVLESIYQGFKSDLAQSLGINEGKSNSELLTIVSRRPQVDIQTLKNLLEHCEDLMQKRGFSEDVLVTVARDMEIWLNNNFKSYRRINHE